MKGAVLKIRVNPTVLDLIDEAAKVQGKTGLRKKRNPAGWVRVLSSAQMVTS